MPTYPYRCLACGYTFEAQQDITSDPLAVCPACGGSMLQREIAQTTFVLKGKGWAADGYDSGSS
jgi:putative FmdB family regulatory protein